MYSVPFHLSSLDTVITKHLYNTRNHRYPPAEEISDPLYCWSPHPTFFWQNSNLFWHLSVNYAHALYKAQPSNVSLTAVEALRATKYTIFFYNLHPLDRIQSIWQSRKAGDNDEMKPHLIHLTWPYLRQAYKPMVVHIKIGGFVLFVGLHQSKNGP